MSKIRPRTEAIRLRIDAACRSGPLRSKKEVAHAILKKWHDEHNSLENEWSHGSGKRINARAPNPDQINPQATWAKYEDGTYPQNHLGWRMVADILGVSVAEIVDFEPTSQEQSGVGRFQSAPGEAPLHRLANLEVSAPRPLKGRNTIDTDTDARQPLALSVKPIFGTLRNEEILDPEGKLLASANVEVAYAYIIVDTNDEFMDVLNGAGFDGETTIAGMLSCRYGGEHDGRNYFELSAKNVRGSLAGTAPTLEDFIELEGIFNKDDWIGVAVESGGLQLREFSTGAERPHEDLDLRTQIMRQILNRGLMIEKTENEQHTLKLTARRYFMRRHLQETEDTKDQGNASNE